jgi:multicomponent Na+:H+ antiporter subunit E
MESGSRRSRSAFGMAFCFLFFLWVVFSGRFDAFHLILGVFSCALVAATSGDLLFTTQTPGSMIRLTYRFLKYIPWLLVQIFLANLHVLYLTFHPRMMDLIDPHIVEFGSRLKSNASRTVLANAITLTPGTITVSVSVLGEFSVHCIDKHSGDSLPGEMERRVAEVFDE